MQRVNACASSRVHKSKLKLKFVCPEEKKGSVTCRHARMPSLIEGWQTEGLNSCSSACQLSKLYS